MMVTRVIGFPKAARRWRIAIAVAFPAVWILNHLRYPAIDGICFTAHTPHRPEASSVNCDLSHRPSNFEFSIKPIAYVFPQFHPIPENDEFWGINFTDWTNVKKVTHNNFGLETLRPTDEVGYYNLLDYRTRARQAKLIRDSGIFGLVYHHYWFGRPVMDKALSKILEDGEPNVPFMLSWANEPWTKRWDGNDASEILLKQVYGRLEDWRRHFDWMVPYFKHPNYIRVNGKVQFMVYNPSHMGDLGKRMFDAWRWWASEEGLGGMDVIETRISPDNPIERGPVDAINEFGFRSGGGWDGTLWPSIDRLGSVYHRGACVTWDNTPRHATDGGGSANPYAHPLLWKLQILQLMRRIKLDPNPRGQENFLFINALNEWGEGNVLEPSMQWGDGFSKAFHEATVMATELPWKHEVIAYGEELQGKLGKTSGDADVCVLIRTLKADWQFSDPFGLSEMLRSLQEQTNGNWRAIVVRANETVNERITKVHVMDAYDPRVVYADIPREVLQNETESSGGWEVTDWAIEHLADLSKTCYSSEYLLIANSSSTYSPTSFEGISDNSLIEKRPDILGLNFETIQTVRQSDDYLLWNQRCSRLKGVNDSDSACVPATEQTPVAILDVGAVFLRLDKFVRSGFRFGGIGSALLGQLVEAEWSWMPPKSTACNLFEGGAYSSCIATGRFWLDTPETVSKNPSGCYSFSSISMDVSQWDMVSWREDPTCLRLSQEHYEA